MKLKADFFQSKDIIVIREMEDGWKLICLWLQMMLLSIENRDMPGLLIYHKTLPYNEDLLGRVTGLSKEIVGRGLTLFRELGMIEFSNDGGIWIESVNECIGESTKEADRKRKYRAKLKRKSTGQIKDKCPINVPSVPDVCPPSSDKRPPEIESESELKLKKKIKIKSMAKKPIPHFRELTDHFQNLYTDKMEGVKPEWGAKQTELLKRDIKKVMGTGDEWCDVLKAAMELFIFDKIPDVERFTQKAGREYGIFHSSLGAILNAMLKEAKR